MSQICYNLCADVPVCAKTRPAMRRTQAIGVFSLFQTLHEEFLCLIESMCSQAGVAHFEVQIETTHC